MKHLKGSSDILVFIYAALVFAAVMFIAIVSTNRMKHALCEVFAGYKLKDVPVRCLTELTK